MLALSASTIDKYCHLEYLLICATMPYSLHLASLIHLNGPLCGHFCIDSFNESRFTEWGYIAVVMTLHFGCKKVLSSCSALLNNGALTFQRKHLSRRTGTHQCGYRYARPNIGVSRITVYI